MYPSVLKVVPNEDFTLAIVFDNGEDGILDMKPYLGFGVFQRMREYEHFKHVRVAFDTIEWDSGVDLDPDTEISSTIGSKEAIFNFPEAILNPGDVVIIPSPGYPPMKTGTVFAEGIPYFVPLLPENNFLLDFESITEEVAKKAKIIY